MIRPQTTQNLFSFSKLIKCLLFYLFHNENVGFWIWTSLAAIIFYTLSIKCKCYIMTIRISNLYCCWRNAVSDVLKEIKSCKISISIYMYTISAEQNLWKFDYLFNSAERNRFINASYEYFITSKEKTK